MIIFPDSISKSDPKWRRACALMQKLALDPRMPPSNFSGKERGFFQCADDYLIRRMKWVDGRWVEDDFYSFSVHFAVSVSIHGRIATDDHQAREEFRLVLNEALQGQLTTAEKERHVLWGERLSLGRAQEEVVAALDERVRAASESAMAPYVQMRKSLEDDRRFRNCGMGSLSTHEEILEGLISQVLKVQSMAAGV